MLWFIFFIAVENLPEVVEHSQHFLFVSCSLRKAEEIERNGSLSEVKMKGKPFIEASDSLPTAY